MAEEERQQVVPDWQRRCPECDGSGMVCLLGEDEDGSVEHGHRRCWFCRGKGMVDID